MIQEIIRKRKERHRIVLCERLKVYACNVLSEQWHEASAYLAEFLLPEMSIQRVLLHCLMKTSFTLMCSVSVEVIDEDIYIRNYISDIFNIESYMLSTFQSDYNQIVPVPSQYFALLRILRTILCSYMYMCVVHVVHPYTCTHVCTTRTHVYTHINMNMYITYILLYMYHTYMA